MADARDLEEAGRFVEALAAYRSCADGAGAGSRTDVPADVPADVPVSDRRYCAARRGVLEPQAADGFVGWSVLAAVRREYRVLGPEEARRRVQAERVAHPEGPAVAALEGWLAEQGKGGADERRMGFQRAVAGVLALIAIGYAGVAAWGWGVGARGPCRGAREWGLGSLAVGWVLLAGVPAVMAWAWGAPDWPWFAGTGSCAIVGVALAPHVSPWLAASGTAALVGLCTFAAGWFDALGVG
ncbi:MAG: hypothetical protein EXR69_03455 [Myxococcales bacterium]|nr:hypothetical protein [Myxococcales bacterium]